MAEHSTPEFDIRRYWAIVRKRRYVALGAALLIVSAFTWGSFAWPKTYEATSTVFIERSSVMDPLIKGVGVSASMEERLRNIKNSITSRNITERVVKKLDLDTRARTDQQLQKLVDDIRDKIAITVKGTRGERETDLFTISYQGSDPRTVRDVVNALVSEYIEENVGFRRSDAVGAYAFIESQLIEYKKRLEESDRAVRDFREKNPTMVPHSEATTMGRLDILQTSRMDSEIKLKELLRKRESLQRQLAGEKEMTVAFVTRDGSPQARLNYLSNQLVLLLTRFTESHPEVRKVRAEIEELKRQMERGAQGQSEAASSETAAINPIYQQIKEEMSRTDAEIETLKARIAELSRQQAEIQARLGKMPKEQEEWAKLQRDRNVYQKIYDDLLQKLENARVSKDLELTDKNATFRVVDPAVLPNLPAKPDRVKMILLGIILGIAGGIGAALGLEVLDRSYKDEDAIESTLKLPVLASIPRLIDESQEKAEKRRDRKVFTAAGAYACLIVVVFAHEAARKFLGLRIVDF